MFAHHNPHIMDIRGESVNMLALLRAVPKIHLGAVAYLEAYIDFVKPKLILSRTDNNATLWQLKRRPNSTYKVALIQNGWRTKHARSTPVGLRSSNSADTYFDTLILEVEQVCDYEFYWDGFDTMPGMSSSYKIFWCKDEKKIKAIIEDFNKTKFEM
jgi:surface carbohydrate biosynthesis protein